jgi:rhodanese-related sulfurtransferase
MSIKDVLKNPKVTIIDVRSPMEFQGGHVLDSLNIPLNEIPQRLEELKAMEGPLVLCCAAGARSAQAVYYLQEQGLKDLHNGGSWMDVQWAQNN